MPKEMAMSQPENLNRVAFDPNIQSENSWKEPGIRTVTLHCPENRLDLQ